MIMAFAEGEAGVLRWQVRWALEFGLNVNKQKSEGRCRINQQASLKPNQQSGRLTLESKLFFILGPQECAVIITISC